MMKNEAEALSRCVRSRLVDSPAVAQWASLLVEAQPSPHWAICELSVCSGQSDENVLASLSGVPGIGNQADAEELYWAFVWDAWSEGELQLREVSWTLCTQGVHVIDYPDSTKWRGCFDDDLDPRQAGAVGEERERLIDEMKKAIRYLAGSATWVNRPKATWRGPRYWE
jgi:hypothetical protein